MATLVDVIAQVQLTLGALVGQSLTTGFGRSQRVARAVPPQVTWVPTSDDFEVGGEQHTGTDKGAARVVAMRLAGCEAHIWGAVNPQTAEDFSATEILLHQVVAALRANLKARSLAQLRGAWSDLSGAEAVSFGRAYVLSFVVRLPVVEQGTVGSTVTIGGNVGPSPATNVPVTNTMAFPDGQVVTNP
jgi:hypothetical protein